jgi:hypothetical protein
MKYETKTTQEALFLQAKELFGSDSMITARLQNPGTIKCEDDIEGMLIETHNALHKKHEEFNHYITSISGFRAALRYFAMEKKLK